MRVAMHWTDGRWHDSGGHRESVNPATGEMIGSYAMAGRGELIALANDSQYGLSASVFSRDVDLPLRVALALESGSVWINDWAELHDQFEEGGFKSSGVDRMRGFAVLEDFIEYKHIRVAPGISEAGLCPKRQTIIQRSYRCVL
jgi:acyl-CoA reductase-like NAD-dependent aldehyde dehydrogenase